AISSQLSARPILLLNYFTASFPFTVFGSRLPAPDCLFTHHASHFTVFRLWTLDYFSSLNP
ncbi:hypothetical protein KAQ80_03500, partial [Candidatus Bipolaricaulota bacterium]|nr:hypothetical protein [Candidatus Bipolaricaulota bacterium]